MKTTNKILSSVQVQQSDGNRKVFIRRDRSCKANAVSAPAPDPIKRCHYYLLIASFLSASTSPLG